jgi:hypothetical protein
VLAGEKVKKITYKEILKKPLIYLRALNFHGLEPIAGADNSTLAPPLRGGGKEIKNQKSGKRIQNLYGKGWITREEKNKNGKKKGGKGRKKEKIKERTEKYVKTS